MAPDLDAMSGTRKAAILMATLGTEAAARIFRSLDDAEIEALAAEISRLPAVDENVSAAVLREFLQMALTSPGVTTGGLGYVQEVLEKALGPKRAGEVVERVQVAVQPARFSAVRRTDPNQLAAILQREHPQTVALILANLEPEIAAEILGGLADDIRAEVVVRMATIDKTSPEVIRQVEQIFEKQVSASFTAGVALSEGAKTVAEVLNRTDPAAQKGILERLDEHSPTLAEQIRALMFTFDDLVQVEDRGLQRILQEVEQKDLVLALKAAGEAVADKIFRNMSERTATVVRQEMEFLGPVRLRDVEEAQRRVVAVARRLRDAGEILVLGAGGGEQIVP